MFNFYKLCQNSMKLFRRVKLDQNDLIRHNTCYDRCEQCRVDCVKSTSCECNRLVQKLSVETMKKVSHFLADVVIIFAFDFSNFVGNSA